MDSKYNYLNKIVSPKVIAEAMRYYGINEIKGKANNATIMSWAKDVGVEKTYTSDEVAWCGLFVAKVVLKAGFEPVKDPLWALNWKNFGTAQKVAKLGDVLVFKRDGGGHVGFYVAEDKDYFHVLGGNQSDSVNIMKLLKSRCVAIRRCPWKIAEPKDVKQYIVSGAGIPVSTNEK